MFLYDLILSGVRCVLFVRRASRISTGDELPEALLKDASGQQHAVLAPETLDAYIGAEPYHLPIVAAAGVRLLEADYIAQLYLHNHDIC